MNPFDRLLSMMSDRIFPDGFDIDLHEDELLADLRYGQTGAEPSDAASRAADAPRDTRFVA